MSSTENDNDPQTSATSELYLFAEEKEALNCIDALLVVVPVDSDGKRSVQSETADDPRDAVLSRWRQIMDRYLECPTLLDQSLERMVQRLAEGVLRHALEVLDSRDCTISTMMQRHSRYALSALYALCKVRGRKTVQKFLPHAVEDFDPVWKALQAVIYPKEGEASELLSSFDSTTAAPAWKSVYMLWNWMAVLSLIPFDCAVVADGSFLPVLMDAIQQHLSDAGAVREAAAACLASWLSRPDLEQSELPHFVEWSVAELSDYTNNSSRSSNASLFRVLGIMQVLVAILKVSPMQRDKLIKQMAPVWDCMLALDDQTTSNLLLRKYLVKWWTRMSCAYLPPRIAPWRYQRGQRSLTENLEQAKQSQGSIQSHQVAQTEQPESKEESLFHVPDQVEDAMGKVIQALSHSSTIVRWSAAKGVGRITERLPSLCAEDVLDAVLENFVDVEKDGCWHGACLTLAELARRGLLLPRRLPDVVPHIVRAVHYDVRRGRTSVGAHVRDAACYTYWAFARAYSPFVLKPYLTELSESIVLTSLFDREVNCRRAASAAFQEAVGRQGAQNFPHGIAILTKADYFSLGNRNDAYLDIASAVAGYEDFKRPIIRHLYRVKLSHWDISIRTLASRSLCKVTELDSAFMGSEVIPFLMDNCLDEKNLEVRHGAVLGVAETVVALAKLDQLADATSDETMADLTILVSKIEKKRLYRGRGGEIMRSAVCRLIECISIAQLPLSVRDQVGLLDTVDASIPHPSESIQESACKALQSLMIGFFPVGENGPSARLQTRVVDKFISIATKSENPAATRGYTLALGHLPAKLLAPSHETLKSILDCLRRSARHNMRVSDDSDAETRRNSLLSLIRVSETVGINRALKTSSPLVALTKQHISEVFETFLLALEDYKTDRRGDVGSWCRLVAMDGLVSLSRLSVKASVEAKEVHYDPSLSNRMVGALLKQFSEKLDNVRERAGACLYQILSRDGVEIPGIDQKHDLMKALDLHAPQVEAAKRNWSDPALTFPMVVQAASIKTFSIDIFAGMAISVGGLTESVSKHATAALLDWAKQARGTAQIHSFTIFLHLMKRHHREGRVILPLLKTLDVLFTHQCLDELVTSKTSFAETLLLNLMAEEKDCQDVHRLFAIGAFVARPRRYHVLHPTSLRHSPMKLTLPLSCRSLFL